MFFNFIKSSYQRVKNALAKTRSLIGDKLHALFRGKLDEEALERLEQILYEADLGVQTAQELTQKIRELHSKHPEYKDQELLAALKKEVLQQLKIETPTALSAEKPPQVILIVGVNGNGKTTTIAKLAHKFQLEGKKVVIAAADTFRAAAIDQLEIWASRLNVDLVKGKPQGDPAAVAYDAMEAAKARGADYVLIDTAGRLHTKTPLMQELEKIKRSCRKTISEAPHETFLVLDASIGQNAIDQAKTFHKYTPITGLVLTKLDGTAKGGIVIGIQKQLGIPVKFIGVGEGIEDLEPFIPENFVNALFE